MTEASLEHAWPREYRVAKGWRWCAATFTSATLIAAVWVLSEVHGRTRGGLLTLTLTGFAMGVVLLAGITVERIRLWPDAIEFRELGRRKRRFARDEILGVRLLPTQYATVHSFELDGGRSPFRTVIGCERDHVLDAWLASLPPLDVIELQQARAELLATAMLGSAPAERQQALERAHRVARALNVASVGLGAWAFFYPRPYGLVVGAVAVLPILGVVTLYAGRGLFTFDSSRTQPRAQLIGPIFAPMVLGVRAVFDVAFVDAYPLVVCSALAGTTAFVVALVRDDALRAKPGECVAIAFAFLFFAAAGPVAMLNVVLDSSESQRFETDVRARKFVPGKGAHYALEIGPWGPYPTGDDVQVPRDVYDELRAGDAVCVDLHAGAIGVRWYRVRACDERRADP